MRRRLQGFEKLFYSLFYSFSTKDVLDFFLSLFKVIEVLIDGKLIFVTFYIPNEWQKCLNSSAECNDIWSRGRLIIREISEYQVIPRKAFFFYFRIFRIINRKSGSALTDSPSKRFFICFVLLTGNKRK